MCRVGTGRINYVGKAGQTVLNTTVKSGTGIGAVFAPTWELVMASKRGVISWQEYIDGYYDLMRTRYRHNKAAFIEALGHDELIVTCYCKDTSTTTRHCHRYLLVDILEKVAAAEGIAFERIGEVR
jgi:hypothetical protein